MGIFADKTDLWARYACKLEMRDQLMGGVPRHPEIIAAWLRTRAGITAEQELSAVMARTLTELGHDAAGAEFSQMVEASEAITDQFKGNGFKRDEHGLYIEERQIKAALKESTNINFAGKRWGVTAKGPRAFLAERVFILPTRIHLRRADGTYITEADGYEDFTGHVQGPKGERATLTRYEYVEHAWLDFELLAAHDAVQVVQEGRERRTDAWATIWCLAEENGLGALRSQGKGRFDIRAMTRLTPLRESQIDQLEEASIIASTEYLAAGAAAAARIAD